jgi:hypothetical protein
MITFAVIFGGSFILALSGALMPGPLLIVTISESARRGFPAGPLLMTGHALPELLLVLAIIKGLGSYLRAPLVIGLIAFIGGIVLIWMGGGHGTNGRHPLSGGERCGGLFGSEMSFTTFSGYTGGKIVLWHVAKGQGDYDEHNLFRNTGRHNAFNIIYDGMRQC